MCVQVLRWSVPIVQVPRTNHGHVRGPLHYPHHLAHIPSALDAGPLERPHRQYDHDGGE